MLRYTFHYMLYLIFLLLLTSCLPNQSEAIPTSTQPATSTSMPTLGSPTPMTFVSNEEYNVYSALIKDFFPVDRVELIIIKDHSATDLAPDETLEQVIQYIRDNIEHIDPETLIAFYDQNQQPNRLEMLFSLEVPYILLTEAEFRQVFSQENAWEDFYVTYPNAQGIMTLSRVGFNTPEDQALVYIGNRAGLSMGEGFYVFLTKKGGGWSIDNSLFAWVQ